MRERETEGRGHRSWGGARRSSMSGRPKLAGVERPSATVLRLPLREHQGREEDEGNSFPSFARPGKGLRTTPWWRHWWPAEARGRGPRNHETTREEHREEAGKQAMLTTARSGARTARNDGFRAEGRSGSPATVDARSKREQRRGGKWGRECLGALGSTRNRGAGERKEWGANVGAGVPCGFGTERGSGRAVGRDEGDRRA